jgi:hypothetical protein
MAETTVTTTTEKGHLRRNWFFYVLLVGLAAFSGFSYITQSKALTQQQAVFESEKEVLKTEAQNTLSAVEKEGLTTTAKALAWATGNRVIFEDYDDVDGYFKQLVKSENILEISYLEEEDGRVLVSTNKKKEEDIFLISNLNAILQTEQVTFLEDDAKTPMVVAPVLNKENKLGVLVILYRTQQLKWQTKSPK